MKSECYICHTEYDRKKDVFEHQEMVHIRFRAGFGSVFGDTNLVELSMCQHCFKKRLGDVVRITDD